MEVEELVEKMLARKKFSSDKIREKTKQALLKTLKPIAKIKSCEDEDAFENAPDEIRYDNSDGVDLTTESALDLRQQEKKDSLRAAARSMFSDHEFVKDEGGVAVAEDVNRKLKWGYTLLHFAACSGDLAECERLLAAGASKLAQDNSGKLPWQKAEINGHESLVPLLKP